MLSQKPYVGGCVRFFLAHLFLLKGKFISECSRVRSFLLVHLRGAFSK